MAVVDLRMGDEKLMEAFDELDISPAGVVVVSVPAKRLRRESSVENWLLNEADVDGVEPPPPPPPPPLSRLFVSCFCSCSRFSCF